ncbi:MAG: PAS domain-containing protein [Proteobacteria bacterium]|nr:PAS domain-containing protein [Pseudomonadota bacterium]
MRRNRADPLKAKRCAPDMAGVLLAAAPDQALLMRLDGHVLVANAAMAALFRLPPEHLAGECLYDFFPAEVVRKWAKAVRQVVECGQPSHFEESFFAGRDLEVRVHPVPGEDGGVDRVAVFCRDITAQKAAERERTRLGSALEQTADPVILYDEMMRVAYINQAFEAMTGYSLHEVRGKPVAAFYVGPEQQASLNQIIEALASGDAWTGKTCNTCKGGSVICCHKTVSPIRGKGGLILGYVSVWRDMTELEGVERQLRRAQKMEALGTLAGGIAHDFNNILSPIVLMADIGLSQYAEGDPQRGAFERILKSAKRAEALVRQILSLGRRHESEQPVPMRLSDTILECLTLLRPSLPSTIDISLAAETERDVVLADPAQVHQLLMNLCTNAAWAMRGTGGALRICVGEHEVGGRGDDEFPDAQPGSYTRLRVQDSGHGIAPEHLERIFDPFFTTRTDSSGTGLGLAVVLNIITRLRGSLRVQSDPGQGACFEILLPRSELPPVGQQAQVQKSAQNLRGTGHVLVVDDEPDILEACVAGLTACGYEVSACLRGEEALELFRASPGKFHVVLSDTTMPGLAGPALVRELLKIEPHLPVILTTGHSDLVNREKAWRLGALEFLAKPFRMDELAALLRKLLASKRHPLAAQED